MKRRSDATYVADLLPYKRILPFIMPKRSESLVYHQFSLDMTNAISFIHRLNREEPGDHKYRVFELFLAALIRLLIQRPVLNRFIMNYDCWQRNELSLNFVVKEQYSDDAPEHSSVIYFKPDMTFPEIADVVNTVITNSRSGGIDNDTDTAIRFFLRFPNIVLRFLTFCLRRLDVHGLAPKALRDADGLHVSAFVANLGSINLTGSPHHHLYEWGNNLTVLHYGSTQAKTDPYRRRDRLLHRFDGGGSDAGRTYR